MNEYDNQEIEFIDEGITLKELVTIVLKYRYLVGIIVFLFLILAGVYLYKTEPVYQASGQILIESPKSSLSMANPSYYSIYSLPTTIATAVESMKGNSITDSVIVKTNAFAKITTKDLSTISYFTAKPTQKTEAFTIMPSQGNNRDSDFIVLNDVETIIGEGRFKKKFISDLFSIILDNLDPEENIKIILLPVRNSRGRILSGLNVSNIRNTNIIRISYKSTLPVFAQEVVNNYIKEFSYLNLMTKREKATVLKTFLENQFENVSEQLENSENNYKDFKLSTGIVAIDAQTNQYIDLLRFLEENRIEYEMKIQEALTSKERSEIILQGDPEFQEYSKFASSPFFQENTILTELYKDIAELQVENARLSSEFNPSHPSVMQNIAKLNAARTQLENTISETINNAAKGIDPLLRPVFENHLLSRVNIKVYESVLNQVKKEIKKIDTLMEKLPMAEVDQSQLQRKMKINEQLYNLLLTNLEEARIMEASTISDVKVVDWAEQPQYPIAPNKRKVILVALLSGLFASGIVIFSSEHFRTSFPTTESIERTLGTHVISLIPVLTKRRKKEKQIFVGFGHSAEEKIIDSGRFEDNHNKLQAFEIFNTLRMNLMISDILEKNKTLVVSSALAKEGKTVTSANLAVTMAHSGMKILVIDCDLRKPAQHTVFNTENSNGLVDLLKNKKFQGNIIKTSYPNLFLLPAGDTKKVIISELVNNAELIATIEKFQSHFDFIIIDTPPINLYTDAAVLSTNFKNVLFVMKYNTHCDAAIYSNKILTNLNANIVGVVVNFVHESRFLGGYYKYGYGYGYSYGYGYGYGHKK